MTTEELYAQIDGSYKDVFARVRSDAFVARFIVMFLKDSSCTNLVQAWTAGDEKACFDAAHMAKGVCANVGLNKLSELTSEVCEALRPGNEALRATCDVDALVG